MVSSILILIIPNIVGGGNLNFTYYLLYIISKISILIFFGIIILRITKSYYYSYLIIGIPYLISSIVEIPNLILLSKYISTDVMKALFYTNMIEIEEFIGKFYLYSFLPFTLIGIYIYILKKYKFISYNLYSGKKIIFTSLILLSISIGISTYKYTNSKYFTYPGAKNLTYSVMKTYYIEDPPINLYYRIYNFLKINRNINKYRSEKENFKFEVSNSKDSIMPNIVIFVIGERIRYSNWSINGYDRQTSPQLEKIKKLVTFQKHYSNGNETNNSIPLIITEATAQNFNDVYRQKTIVSLFKEAGYETSWISNQSNIFLYLNNQNEPNKLYILDKNQIRSTDLDIIPIFDTILNKNTNKKKFIVINMAGGHGKVPARFNKFIPNTSGKAYPFIAQNAHLFINDYDNIILFQDYVLGELIKNTEKRNLSSVFIFTPDHACHLFDGGSLFGYGSDNPTELETHIPLFIWGSDKYIFNNEVKYRNLIKNKNLLTTNDQLFYTISDLANIKYKTFIQELSFADSAYYEPKSRYVYTTKQVFEFKK